MIILIGDTHGFIDDFQKQKEIINKYNPEYVLSEQMQNISLITKKDYEKYSKKENIINLCKKNKIKLIGIDLKNFGLNKHLQEIIRTPQKLPEKDKKSLKEIVKKREIYQLKIIKSVKSSRPIIVLIGSWHLRKSSPILKELNNYLLIFPSKNKKLITKPTKNITYSTTFVNKY